MSRLAAPARAASSGPSTRTSPRSWWISAIRMRIVVDLPAPFGPTKPMIWPCGSDRLMSRSWKKRYALLDSLELDCQLGHRSFLLSVLASRLAARAGASSSSSAVEPELRGRPRRRSRCSSSSSCAQLRAEIHVLRHERALALPRHDHARALELEVGALHGDHAHLRRDRERPDRRDLLPGLPVADRDPMPDLLHDLEVHRAPVGVGDGEITVHIEYAQYIR